MFGYELVNAGYSLAFSHFCFTVGISVYKGKINSKSLKMRELVFL